MVGGPCLSREGTGPGEVMRLTRLREDRAAARVFFVPPLTWPEEETVVTTGLCFGCLGLPPRGAIVRTEAGIQ